MHKLHPKQSALLNLLREHQEEPLTVRELKSELDVSSTSVVTYHLKQLEEKGYLKRNPEKPRDYVLLSPEKSKTVAYVPIYGAAECGLDGDFLSGEVLDMMPIAPKMINFPAEEAFVVEASGSSMTPMIEEGDYVIARKSNAPQNGDIVICTNEGAVLVKKYHKDTSGVMLQSLNFDFPPFLAEEDFHVQGVVKRVIKRIAD